MICASDDSRSTTIRWLVVLLAGLAVVVIMALVMTYVFDGTSHDYDFGMMGSWDDTAWLMMLVPAAIILVILVAVLVTIPDRQVRYGSAYAPPSVQMEPMAILDRRLASGDLSLEEYSKLKNELSRR